MPRRGADGSEQSSAYSIGHPTDGQASLMWLDACIVAGAPQFPTEAYPGSTLRYANMPFTPTAGVGGSVAPY